MKKVFILFAITICAVTFASAQKMAMTTKETATQALMRMRKRSPTG
jgi:hypothetical protein